MPGTFAVDVAATFSAAVLVSAMPKEKFGQPGTQETDSAGTLKWSVEAAVTFAATNGIKLPSELLTITITDRTHPAQGLNPGTPVVFEGLRVGLNPAELNGNRIKGGKLWYTATAVRAFPVQTRRESAS